MSPPQVSSSGNPGRRFDNRTLRLATWLVWTLPLIWGLAVVLAPGSFTPSLIRYALIPCWFMVAVGGAYYLHLAARRFHIGLVGFVIVMLLWGHVSIYLGVLGGWDVGLTTAVFFGALLTFALAWSGSVSQLLEYRGRWARFGLTVLGGLFPLALWVLPFSLAWVWLGLRIEAPNLFYGSLLLGASAVAIIVWWLVFQRRARRQAWKLLQA